MCRAFILSFLLSGILSVQGNVFTKPEHTTLHPISLEYEVFFLRVEMDVLDVIRRIEKMIRDNNNDDETKKVCVELSSTLMLNVYNDILRHCVAFGCEIKGQGWSCTGLKNNKFTSEDLAAIQTTVAKCLVNL